MRKLLKRELSQTSRWKQHVVLEIALAVVRVSLCHVFLVQAGTTHLGSRHMEVYLRNQTQRASTTAGLNLNANLRLGICMWKECK